MDNETLLDTKQEETQELSHADKFAGVFAEPKNTFHLTSLFPIRAKDWLIPLLLVALITAGTTVVKYTNPQVRTELNKTATEKQNEAFDKLVKEGKMSREQADENIDKSNQIFKSSFFLVIVGLQTFFMYMIMFFFFALIYWVLGKHAFKGSGTYSSALVAQGLSSYISLISVVIATIITMLTNTLHNDTSIAALLKVDSKSALYFPLSLIDIFAIWWLVVQSIGLTKLFRLKSMVPFLIVVFIVFIALKSLIFLF